mmetsp:Transcript_25813/g.37849  ORF Transcript_25813/g.37849 Transcript_25813/m.37849 type:complete len:89 (-) Transcript_25813:54-320(-)
MTLTKMACIGYQCDIRTLQLICDKDDGNKNPEKIIQSLDIAIKEGLVKKIGTWYKFTHDRIQTESYSLIPEQDHDLLYFQMETAIQNS